MAESPAAGFLTAGGKAAHFQQHAFNFFSRRDFPRHCTVNFLYTAVHMANLYIDKVQAYMMGVNLNIDTTAFRGISRPLA